MADENFRSAEFAHVFRGHRLSSPHVQERVTNAIVFHDSLIIGPSDCDLRLHAEKRGDFLAGVLPKPVIQKYGFVFDDDAVLETVRTRMKTAKATIIWTSSDPNDQLFLWWLCSGLTRSCLEECEIYRGSLPEDRTADVDELGAVFSTANAIDARDLRRLAQNWRSFATGRLDELLAEQAVIDAIKLFLPRVRRGTLWLSPLDSHIITESTRKESAGNFEVAGRIISQHLWLGSYFVFHRIDQWAAAEIAGIRFANVARWNRKQCVTTDSGRRLLEHGIEHVKRLPPLRIGATDAYGPGETWVVTENGDICRQHLGK
jgi:hypothetical protein